MRWQARVVVEWVLSAPGGDRLAHVAQRHVTHSLPTPPELFAAVAGRSIPHIAQVGPHLRVPIAEATFYEFGAGHELIGPLVFYGLGVNHQIVHDIRPLLRAEYVNAALDKLRRGGALSLHREIPDICLTRDSVRTQLESELGIRYQAPRDAEDTGLASASVDCITTTSTLEHIAAGALPAILAECYRVLKPDGVMSHAIDYKDHYSYGDPRIRADHFLRFSPRQWRFLNPPRFYQNRLRHADYLRLFRDAGFLVLAERCDADGGGAQVVLRKARR